MLTPRRCRQRGGPRRCEGAVGLPHGDVVGFKDATTESELTLMSALTQQPVSSAIEADQSFFHLYETGVTRGPVLFKMAQDRCAAARVHRRQS